MTTTRIAITESEVYPEYRIEPVHPEILAENPRAGYEVDQALVDEYNQAGKAWDTVQVKLGALIREREQADDRNV